MNAKKLSIGLGLIVTLLAILIGILHLTPLSYLYCISREGSWMKSSSQSQLESKLIAFYTKSEIQPSESSWGSKHQLKEGQRMVRYMIFGKEPLDVVVSEDGSVDTIYTTYE